MVYLLKMVIFHGKLLNNQMVTLEPPFFGIGSIYVGIPLVSDDSPPGLDALVHGAGHGSPVPQQSRGRGRCGCVLSEVPWECP